MKPPDSVVVCGHTLRVIAHSDRHAGLTPDNDPSDVGAVNVAQGEIRVLATDESTPHNQRDTLLHEVIHAVLTLTGLTGRRDDVWRSSAMAERVVDNLGTHLLDTFRRNPELVAYLMDDAMSSERSRKT